MDAQQNVEHARLIGGKAAVWTQHRQDGFGSGLTGNEGVHDHGFAVIARALRVIRQHHDARQARYERKRGVNLVLGGPILGVRVMAVEEEHRSSQHVHDVGRRVAHDHGGGEAVRQLALGVNDLDEGIKLGLRGKLAHKQQIGDFFKGKATIARLVAEEVVEVVAAQAKRALVSQLFAVGDNVAVHVGNIGHAGDHARAVGVAQAALDVIAVVVSRIDAVNLSEFVEQADLLGVFGVDDHLFSLRLGVL